MEHEPQPFHWTREVVVEPRDDSDYETPLGTVAARMDYGSVLSTTTGIALALEKTLPQKIRFAIIETSGLDAGRSRAAEIATTELANGLARGDAANAFARAQSRIRNEGLDCDISYTACLVDSEDANIETRGSKQSVVFRWENWTILMSADTARIFGSSEYIRSRVLRFSIGLKGPDPAAVADYLYAIAETQKDRIENITLVVFKKSSG